MESGLFVRRTGEIGLEVGTDVPYCVYGSTAFVGGKGRNPSAPSMPQCWVVLVKPRMSVSTRTVFRK